MDKNNDNVINLFNKSSSAKYNELYAKFNNLNKLLAWGHARAEFVKRMEEMQKKYNLSFSKGVSDNVKEQAKKFVETYSKERLQEVAKMHFKTSKEI